ncbi:GCN5-related N-acetyltransferase [Mesorhizobium ciceri biovar biserrulae WSM1271]|uniref:GCN5-related N-acetyltransferase n=2 Tax=Mesorhizobium ciceri TaxID=39645 RepID=E8TJD8_MESCW|nr:GCN5-related N-acetyltransferase [Mesorhizobium ciceri biovar biserrulae WSM1271]
MSFRVEPLSRQNWPALVDLFSASGPVGRCWCMYGRIGPAYRKQPPDRNRHEFQQAALSGDVPQGLLAFDGEMAVGWCQITPIEAVPYLKKRWIGAEDRREETWFISCFYVRKGYRRRGMTRTLIEASIAHARRHGAKAIEAMPLDGGKSPSATGSGYVSTFESAGFQAIAHRDAARPLMRLSLS